jgi:hypothetical protein
MDNSVSGVENTLKAFDRRWAVAFPERLRARVEILLSGLFFDGCCGSFGWDGNCKVEPPLSFDVVFVRPLKERNLADQLEGFCTEFTNWRKLVNIPIRQLPYFQRFTSGNWIASLTASEDAQKTKREERC